MINHWNVKVSDSFVKFLDSLSIVRQERLLAQGQQFVLRSKGAPKGTKHAGVKRGARQRTDWDLE